MKKSAAFAFAAASIFALVAAGCGPSATDPEGGGDDDVTGGSDAGTTMMPPYTGPVGTLEGTVWAPGNAPGQVPAGHEIPVAGALVYLTTTMPPPIPQEVYCDKCANPPGAKYVLANEKGVFKMEGILPGTYWVAIQKGQFRFDQRVEVPANQTVAMTSAQTTLPSEQDPTNGKWIPRIALASGNYDKMQDIFGKMGLGTVSAAGTFTSGSQGMKFDVYKNGGAIDSSGAMTFANLVSDLTKMRQYHIIFVPCASDMNTSSLQMDTVRANIKEYVKQGGKFYVTDWSAEWEDTVFPEYIQFDGSTVDTAAGAAPSAFGDGDGIDSYESYHAKAENLTLNKWMMGQTGPTLTATGGVFGGVGPGPVAAFNADDFVVEGNWDRIVATPRQQIGTDMDNLPVYSEAHAFVVGDWGEDTGARNHPLTVTFEPAGCGRVLYSTYHTAESTHVGLLPQERVLLYLIMEIGVCKTGPVID